MYSPSLKQHPWHKKTFSHCFMIRMLNEGKVWQDKQANGYSELYNCNSKEITLVSFCLRVRDEICFHFLISKIFYSVWRLFHLTTAIVIFHQLLHLLTIIQFLNKDILWLYKYIYIYEKSILRSSRLHVFDYKNTVKTIILWNIVKCKWFLWCQAEFIIIDTQLFIMILIIISIKINYYCFLYFIYF